MKTASPSAQRFRFSDVDPETGHRYLSLRFAHLPGWTQDVVLHIGVRPHQWNELVSDGLVMEQPDLAGDHELPREINGGNVQDFHARQSAHPGYTWEQYKRDTSRRSTYQVVDVADPRESAWF
jgi:hypothetical protein